MTLRKPKASRPKIPDYGIEEGRKNLLPWRWAEERLANTKNYFLSTVRRDGRPHVMPIWGVWIAGQFYFSTGKDSVKARNLAANPHCVLCPGGADEAVILEGIAETVLDKKMLTKFARVYVDKYEFDVSQMNQPVFVVRPQIVFGHIEKTYTKTATRWTFG
jgi:hypothetical protein